MPCRQTPGEAGAAKARKKKAKRGSSFTLRNRDFRCEARVDDTSTHVSVANLSLDELELASLRGAVEEANLDVDLSNRNGRGNVALAGPRFSGVRGEMLSGSFRWEGDIVRLERALLQQQNSRYELQGEYVLPTVGIATSPPKKSLVEMVAMNEAGLPWAAGGRWRWSHMCAAGPELTRARSRRPAPETDNPRPKLPARARNQRPT